MTAGITCATRVYLHLAHPSAHARSASGCWTRRPPGAASRIRGLPMLAGQVDLILEFLELSAYRPG